tara:strand:+ start:158 stop:583 length:426 start_codon:yes stop_codon:yes gene_type:complete
MNKLKDILKGHGLKFTENRKVILEQFISSNYALSYKDIDAMISKKLDKVTVYRNLKSFEEKGIIHEVIDGSTQIKYALCHSESCSSHNHNDAHVHFKCDDCFKTFCLDELIVPDVKLPKGFKLETQTVFVQGVCNMCTSSK